MLQFTTSLRNATTKKKFLVFKTTVLGNLGKTFPVESGGHKIRVHVFSPDEGYDQKKEINHDFKAHARNTLQVDFGKSNRELQLRLR